MKIDGQILSLVREAEKNKLRPPLWSQWFAANKKTRYLKVLKN